MLFDRAPHAVMHFGMTGWMQFDGEKTHYYRQAKEQDPSGRGGKGAGEDWPPKYMKFLLHSDKEKVNGEEREAVESAFVDARRLARIRLVHCDADRVREETPLKENGPDPVRDRDIVTVEWLKELLGRKRVPIKALLLDQANLSGVGNWVADEVLYQARLHPEQYSNTFDDEQTRRLHGALIDVCTLAVKTLADSTQFPETWLMKYRWDKGKKDKNTLPNGEKIVHLKVGGRTSAIVPSVQKKTAAVAGDVDPAELDGEDEKPAKGRKRSTKAAGNAEEDEGEERSSKKGRRAHSITGKGKAASINDVKQEHGDVEAGGGAEGAGEAGEEKDKEIELKPAAKRSRSMAATTKKKRV